MKKQKSYKSIRVSYEKAKEMHLIPLKNVHYKFNSETQKIEMFVLSPDFKKMKTYENYKKGVNEFVDFIVGHRRWSGEQYVVLGNTDSLTHRLDNVYPSALQCYTVDGFDKIDDPCFTTAENLDKYIENVEKKCIDELAEKQKKQERIDTLKKAEQDLFNGF